MKNFKRRFGLFSIMALCFGAGFVCSACAAADDEPIVIASNEKAPKGYTKVRTIGHFSDHRVDLVRRTGMGNYAAVCVDITVDDVYLGQLNDVSYDYFVYEDFEETKGDFIRASYSKGILTHDDLLAIAKSLGVSQPTND